MRLGRPGGREQLVDELVRDALAALAALAGAPLSGPVAEAAQLLALVAGQDVSAGADGVFRIARRVAKDRIIATVDPQARHGHQSMARRFDGFKAHLAVDPDDELITQVAVTAANVPDRDVVAELLTEAAAPAPATVVGDSAYAAGATLDELTAGGHEVIAKVPPARNQEGLFTKDDFDLDLEGDLVTCPARQTAQIRPAGRGGGRATFGQVCASCPLRGSCTRSPRGRSIAIHPHERALQAGKAAQQTPHWRQRYRSARPTVERKISHFTRRPWGGRRARCRGEVRILTDALSRAGALNLARLAVLGLRNTETGWAIG